MSRVMDNSLVNDGVMGTRPPPLGAFQALKDLCCLMFGMVKHWGVNTRSQVCVCPLRVQMLRSISRVSTTRGISKRCMATAAGNDYDVVVVGGGPGGYVAGHPQHRLRVCVCSCIMKTCLQCTRVYAQCLPARSV